MVKLFLYKNSSKTEQVPNLKSQIKCINQIDFLSRFIANKRDSSFPCTKEICDQIKIIWMLLVYHSMV